ncbi:MAG: hypothetical protein QOJ42_962 [Acidobacteriaceae bacterium]|nr:hypothetical protein [Acidobacteriaceae bacterium]
MKKRSLRSLCAPSALACFAFILLAGCGKSIYFGGRALPPSGILNRVLIAVQNPGALTKGTLEIVDAFYDIRHSFNNSVPSFSLAGYSGADPITIQNMPEEQAGAVYGAGDGSYALLNYASEKQNTTVSLPGQSSGVFISRDERYVFAANQTAHTLTVQDRQLGTSYGLNVPNIYRVSTNPSGSAALAFVQDSNLVYSVYKLQTNQKVPSNAVDCEPQNIPVFCALPVPGTFDRPTKAVFSADGATAFVLNCGPECGGTQASISFLPVAGIIIQSGAPVPPGAPSAVTATIPVPGGVTNALQNGNLLYIAGQQLQSDGFFAGFLSILDLGTQKITGNYSISDGTHTRMNFGDDNTLWIGSQLCTQGERYHLGATTNLGCLTMFNTAKNSVTMIGSYKGDATGVASVLTLHKVYTAEGGQVYIYSTVDGSALDNSQVTVVGTAYDVAYMDSPSDANNTTY